MFHLLHFGVNDTPGSLRKCTRTMRLGKIQVKNLKWFSPFQTYEKSMDNTLQPYNYTIIQNVQNTKLLCLKTGSLFTLEHQTIKDIYEKMYCNQTRHYSTTTLIN